MRAPPESLSPITGAPARMARSMILQIFSALGSDNGSSLGRGFLWRKNSYGEMRSDPSRAKKQDDTKKQFRAHGCATLERRFKRSHIFGSLNKNKHGA